MLRPNDEAWFEAQFDWTSAHRKYGIPLPSLPSEEVQTKFTSLEGHQNLLQAFCFYKEVLKCISGINEPKILDFGCGWGENLALFSARNFSVQHVFG